MKNIFEYINVGFHVIIVWLGMLKFSKISFNEPIYLYISKLKLLLSKK